MKKISFLLAITSVILFVSLSKLVAQAVVQDSVRIMEAKTGETTIVFVDTTITSGLMLDKAATRDQSESDPSMVIVIDRLASEMVSNVQTITLYSGSGNTIVGGSPVRTVSKNQAWSIISGTSWVSPSKPPNGTTITFEDRFTLPVGATDISLTVRVLADDQVSVSLNGQQVGPSPLAPAVYPAQSASPFRRVQTASANEPAFTFNTGDTPNVLRFAVAQVFGGDFGLDYLATITYNEGLDHFQVTIQPDTISHNETAVISVQAKDDNGEDFIIPDETEVDFLLNVNGELYGNLIAPDGTQDKRFFGITYADAKAGQVKYIANGEAPTDWAEPPVQIEVQHNENPDIDGIGTLQIQPLHHFEVTVAEDSIAHRDTVTITIQAKNVEDKDINLSDDTKVDFSLDANGEKYGSLLGSDDRKAKSLTGVLYGDAKAGKVRYVADGENPCSPAKYIVYVRKSDKPEVTGEDTNVVKCGLELTHYTQGDSRWGDDDYDFYKQLDDDGEIVQPENQYKIRQKGCAMTCMAMILQSAGMDYTPATLNEAMNENGHWGTHSETGNWTGAVKWRAVTDLGNSKFKNGAILIGSDATNWTPRTPIATSELDPYLERCSYAIVLVGNQPDEVPAAQSNHWVLVTGKKDGEYKILDPGGYSGRTTLAAYNNTIYRAVIYERNCNEE